jgi:hypothetical protein
MVVAMTNHAIAQLPKTSTVQTNMDMKLAAAILMTEPAQQ